MRRSWTDGPMCSWDTETTGINVETARIVTSAAAVIQPGEAPVTAELLINPGVEIPEESTKVHGITTEQAQAEGAEAAAGVASIVTHLFAEVVRGVPLVVFNAPYDLTLLDRECRRHGLETLSEECAANNVPLYVIDPLLLDKAVNRYRKGKRTLSVLSEHYGVPLSEEDAHTALGDCLASARVAWKIGRAYSEVGTLSLEHLQKLQADAQAAWAKNYEQYLRTKKNQPDAVVSRAWPIQPLPTGSEVAA